MHAHDKLRQENRSAAYSEGQRSDFWLHSLPSFDMRICACQALDLLPLPNTHTYRFASRLVAARLGLHLSCSHAHVWLHFYYKLVISDHFCNFHLSLDCLRLSPVPSPLSTVSPGHALHHASDSKSCFRLAYLYIRMYVYFHIYLSVCMRSKQKRFSGIWVFLAWLGLALLLTSLQVTYASFLSFYFILFICIFSSLFLLELCPLHTLLRCLICIFIDFEKYKNTA